MLPSYLVSATGELSTTIEGIRKRYGHLPGFTVPYEREIITRSMAMLGAQQASDLATGQIHFKPPHFLRVQQETPNPEAVISDGETLWWYIPQKKQAYRYPSHKLGKELKVLGDIFQGLRKAEETFVITLAGHDGNDERRLALRPKPPWPDIDHITLSVTREDCRIRKVEIHNVLGGMTRFKLGDILVQERFKEGFFSFSPPEGVKVIEEN
jgi:outer membrane lipoprotein carrier protein